MRTYFNSNGNGGWYIEPDANKIINGKRVSASVGVAYYPDNELPKRFGNNRRFRILINSVNDERVDEIRFKIRGRELLIERKDNRITVYEIFYSSRSTKMKPIKC